MKDIGIEKKTNSRGAIEVCANLAGLQCYPSSEVAAPDHRI